MSAALRRLGRPWEVAVFLQLPAVVVVWLGWAVLGHGGTDVWAGVDFATFRDAGRAILDGHSPYVHPTAELLAANDRFVYPAPFAIPFIPFALVPERIGVAIFLVLSVAAVLASLRLFGVRDWRCYGLALLGAPTFLALGIGTIGPMLLLLCALGWRYRDRTIAGVPLALAAAAKLFLWPVLLWLLVTRRFRAFAASLATIAVTLALWAAIDLQGLRWYPETVRLLNEVQRWKSYSVQSLSIALHATAQTSALIAGAVAALAVIVLVLLRNRPDPVAFSASIVVALISTPILWNHYLVLLLAPIALLRPRLAPVWLLPLVLWATPHPDAVGVAWRMALVLAVVGVVAVQVARESSV